MFRIFAILLLLAAPLMAAAQQTSDGSTAGVPASDEPVANPGRPTVSTPATLTPVGYLQFETGYMHATDSPEFSSQSNLNEVVKFSVSPRLELLVADGPFAHSRVQGQPGNGTGGVSLGAQGVVYNGEGARPTVALSYFHEVYNGNTPDLDIGSAKNSALLLLSADIRGFHFDTNFLFNEVLLDQVPATVRRAQFGQTLSISHPLAGKFGLSGEIWRFTQPFRQSNAIGNLWAVNYNWKKNLVLDAGFDRGLTNTSTQWEVFTGFTYLLPHKLLPHKALPQKLLTQALPTH
jgi:hypothetical protein